VPSDSCPIHKLTSQRLATAIAEVHRIRSGQAEGDIMDAR